MSLVKLVCCVLQYLLYIIFLCKDDVIMWEIQVSNAKVISIGKQYNISALGSQISKCKYQNIKSKYKVWNLRECQGMKLHTFTVLLDVWANLCPWWLAIQIFVAKCNEEKMGNFRKNIND